MNIDALRAYCLSFPDATEGLQWGDHLLFRLRGKIFALVALDVASPQRITLKSTPEKVIELLEIDGIERAAYVGRYNWIALLRLDVMPWSELKQLIRESYELVAAKYPKKKASTQPSRRNPARSRLANPKRGK